MFIYYSDLLTFMRRKSRLIDEFEKIGKRKEPEPEVYDKKIYDDGRQYSLKIPRVVMHRINFKKGDKIRLC